MCHVEVGKLDSSRPHPAVFYTLESTLLRSSQRILVRRQESDIAASHRLLAHNGHVFLFSRASLLWGLLR
jgi:hypothetical protein